MDENNQRIEQINKQIEEMQKIYDVDLERGKDEENDQIQANREKKIESLKEELKEVEIEKYDALKNRRKELNNIVSKKTKLLKEKKQIEDAINDMSSSSEFKDGKLSKTQEQIEYEKDLEKINVELEEVNKYVEELKDVNEQTNSIRNKYGLDKLHSQPNNEVHDLSITPQSYISVIDIEELDEEMYKSHKQLYSIDGMYAYLYTDYSSNEFEGKEYNKVIYLDKKIDFEKINNDIEYAEIVKSFLAPDRVKRYSNEAQGKGVEDFVHMGWLEYNPKIQQYVKHRHFPADEKVIYEKLSKKECESLLDLNELVGGDEYFTKKLDSIKAQRPDIYEMVVKEREAFKSEKENVSQEHIKESSSNEIKENIEVEDKPKQAPISQENNVETPIRSQILNNTEPINNSVRTGNESNYGTQEKAEENNIETAMIEYKAPNRFVSWIKEKFNNIKEFFSKNKSNDIELDANGQAWKDYIVAQEGNENKTETSKRESFVNSITMNNKLKKQEQQKKAFEAVKKWEQQNKTEIEQENNDREL